MFSESELQLPHFLVGLLRLQHCLRVALLGSLQELPRQRFHVPGGAEHPKLRPRMPPRNLHLFLEALVEPLGILLLLVMCLLRSFQGPLLFACLPVELGPLFQRRWRSLLGAMCNIGSMLLGGVLLCSLHFVLRCLSILRLFFDLFEPGHLPGSHSFDLFRMAQHPLVRLVARGLQGQCSLPEAFAQHAPLLGRPFRLTLSFQDLAARMAEIPLELKGAQSCRL
mmetsp:Transcript_24303/g.54075  ORF Transcript_24303/g.54075 Transcript_24303/m.54075 type:complete len:224 (-) Transcript_24303:430-1101(-)